MRLFAPALAFVDLETTGMHAEGDRITEVAIVRVEADPAEGTVRVDAWSSLIDPGVPIPAGIQAMTGITDAMVRGAPAFSAVVGEIAQRLNGCQLIAHNARFDYGFLKHAFARLARPFTARMLCTVRLSRRLFPGERSHSLDALIARHGLSVESRHRALGDAQALWQFVQALYATLPPERIEEAVRGVLKVPSLPASLAPEALESIPEAPGVYLFYGDNELPLYIGKSRNLRDRVASHFSGDWRRESDRRLAAEIRRIECERTAGEFGALLREAMLIKSLLPAHNRALRRKADAGVMRLHDDGGLEFVPSHEWSAADDAPRFGPFSSRRAMRATLTKLAGEHRLCWSRLGLERRSGPCFARQLRRCAGACDGREPVTEHDQRLRDALAPLAIPAWPFAGPALLREADAEGEQVDVHVLHHWSWLGTARDEGELSALLDAPPRLAFDLDVTRLALRTFAKQPGRFVAADRVAGS